MGTILKAFEKSNIKVTDIPEINDDIIITELKPNLIREDNAKFFQDHLTFPEEYIIKV
jgi:hypothetical protein